MKRGGPLRRTALLRATPMRRTRMVRRFRSTSYARRERDTPRMRWVKTLACAVLEPSDDLDGLWLGPAIDRCDGVIEAHHAGRRGMSHKADDDTVIPLCKHHHDGLDEHNSIWIGWPRGTRQPWFDAAIAIYQARYATTELRGDRFAGLI